MKRNSYKSTQEVLHDGEKKLQKIYNPIRPLALPILLSFFVLLDLFTIYELMDRMFYQNPWLSRFIAIGIAIVLEGIPYIAAQFYMREKKDMADKITLAILGGVFLLIFMTLFGLRWNARTMMFSSNEESKLSIITSIQAVVETETEYKTSAAEDMMTLLLAITPLATSVLAFFLSCFYRTSNKIRDRKRLNAFRLEDQLKALSIRQNEIHNELQRDLSKYNTDLYNVALDQLGDYETLLKNMVRQKLCMYLGTAAAVSEILEKNEED